VTRFLSFIILLLHLLSDIRHRAALATTAAIVTVIASGVIVGTMASGVMAAQDVPKVSSTHVVQPEPHVATVLPLPTRKQYHLSNPPSLELPKLPTKNPTQANNPSPAAESAPAGTSSVPASVVPPAPTQNTIDSSVLVRLAEPQTQCMEGKWTFTIANATAALRTPTVSDGQITWYWETRIDNGPAPSNAPVDNSPITQAMHAGDSVINFVGSNESQPLLTAPVSTLYSYSVRLHITGPFDAVSSWTSVPANATACPTLAQ
jgi:hypothetical protein